MIRIGVLNNLRSGRGQERVESVLSLLPSHPDALHVETASASLVPEALADFEREGVELLVVNGGDGTLQRLLTELLSRDEGSWLPAIAPIISRTPVPEFPKSSGACGVANRPPLPTTRQRPGPKRSTSAPNACLVYTSPSPRDRPKTPMPSPA